MWQTSKTQQRELSLRLWSVCSLNRSIQMALSNSRNAVSFSSARTTKRFPWSQWAAAIQILRPSESKRGNRPQRWTQLDVRLADYRLGGKTICPFPTRQYVVRLSTPECAALLTSRRSFFLYSSLPGIVFSCHSLNPQHSVAPIIIAIYRLQTFYYN